MFNKKNKIDMLTNAIFFYINHGSIYEEFFGWKTNQSKPITNFENTNSQYWPLSRKPILKNFPLTETKFSLLQKHRCHKGTKYIKLFSSFFFILGLEKNLNSKVGKSALFE